MWPIPERAIPGTGADVKLASVYRRLRHSRSHGPSYGGLYAAAMPGTDDTDRITANFRRLTFDPRRARIGCPLLVLHGGHDVLFGLDAQQPFLEGAATQAAGDGGLDVDISTMTRDELIAHNLKVVDVHFHNENPETIDKTLAVYGPEITWEVPADPLLRDEGWQDRP